MTLDEAKREIAEGSKAYNLTKVLLDGCLSYSYILEYEPCTVGFTGDLVSIGYNKKSDFVSEVDALTFINLHRHIPSDGAKSLYLSR